jgi:hypothetical protein
MKNMIKIASVAVVAFALTQTLQAVPINGSIGFTGTGVTYTGNGPGASTGVTSWINPYVASDTGAFQTPGYITPNPGEAVTFEGNNTTTWLFNTTSPILNFWVAGNFTFELLSSSITSQGGSVGTTGFVVVNGMGIISATGANPAGFTPTLMSWSFTSQDPAAGSNPTSWTFSASANSVPDGGSTVMLLGLALSGVALLKKKFVA